MLLFDQADMAGCLFFAWPPLDGQAGPLNRPSSLGAKLVQLLRKRSLFHKKNIAELTQTAQTELQPHLGALDLTLLGIGCIMGTGVFVLTGRAAAAYAGPAVTLSFVIAAICAGLAAMCYAEMASMLPVSGSAYVYAYATMGELPAFIMGWNLALQYLVGAATVAAGWSGYACAVWASLGLPPVPWAWAHAPLQYNPAQGGLVWTGAICNLPAVAIIVAVCTVLSRGIEASARVNAVIVAVKLSVVALFLAFALPHVNTANWQPYIPASDGHGAFGVLGVFRASTMLFFAYLGFDAVSVAAGETKNPKRDVPIGILASLGICAFIYVCVAAVLTGVVPYGQLDVTSPLAVGVGVVGKPWLALAVDLGAIAGLTSVMLVQLLAEPRILLAMAKDGLLPQVFNHVHPRFRTPSRLTWLSAAICAIAAGLFPIDVLADLTSEGTLLVFVLVGLGVLLLRHSQPDMPRKFRVPGGAWLIPVACMATSIGLMAVAWRSAAGLLLWMSVGAAVYFGNARPRLAKRPQG